MGHPMKLHICVEQTVAVYCLHSSEGELNSRASERACMRVCVCVHAMRAYTGDVVKLHSSLTWAPDKCSWSTSYPSSCTHRNGPQNTFEKRKMLALPWFWPWTMQPIALVSVTTTLSWLLHINSQGDKISLLIPTFHYCLMSFILMWSCLTD